MIKLSFNKLFNCIDISNNKKNLINSNNLLFINSKISE